MATKEKSKAATEVVAKMVDLGIKASGKTAAQIARECHFNNACFISLMRRGNSRVPIGKIGDIARAIGFDVTNFRNRVVQEYLPELWELDMKEGILPIAFSLSEQKAIRIMKIELDKDCLIPDEEFYKDLRDIVAKLKARAEKKKHEES